MKGRLVLIVHLAVLLAVAATTWFVFQKEDAVRPGGQVILEVTVEQLDRLEYRTANNELLAEAIAGGEGFRLTLREKLSKRKSAKKAAPESEQEAADEYKITRYRASAEFGKALDKLLPLVAIRELPQVSEEKLAEFGLLESTGLLSITSRGQTISFQVGEKTYGRASVYVRRDPDGPDGPDGTVYLVSSGLLRTVDFKPPRYKELRFLGLASKDVERLDLECDGMGARALVHRNRFQAGGGDWALADETDADDANDELYSNWVGKLFKLRLTEYLAKPVEPGPGARCKLGFRLDGGKSSSVELTWTEDPSGKRSFFGRSDFSGDWVKLEHTAAGSLVSDLSSILGGEDLPSP